MNFSEYAAHDAVGLMRLVRNGEVSARELHDTALAAIEALNPQVNAVVTRSEADAAHALVNLDSKAPFAGLPFLMKDGGVMAGQRLVMGAKFAKELLCPTDAEVTRRLKRSGVVILGSTNAPELGNSCTTENLLDGPACNPWNLAHSTGGSSGGSAAAVAAGIVPVAHSSDGGGSIRTPAHLCGVFGLKPSRGRNPVGPQQAGGTFGYGVHHVCTRSVRDSAAFLDVLHGDEPGAWYRVAPPVRPFAQEVGANPGRLRIAFSSVSPSPFATSPECIAAVNEAASLCESLGHHVEEAAPTYDWEAFRSAFHDNWVAGIPFRMAQLESLLGIKIGPEHLEPCNWTNLHYARSMTIDQYQLAIARLFQLTRDVESFFDKYDVLITPVNRGPAAQLGVMSPEMPFEGTHGYWDRICAGVGPYLPIFNANGQPAMSVPFTTSADGLPIGIHCVGRFGDDAGLIRLASQIETARPWIHRRPPVHVSAYEGA